MKAAVDLNQSAHASASGTLSTGIRRPKGVVSASDCHSFKAIKRGFYDVSEWRLENGLTVGNTKEVQLMFAFRHQIRGLMGEASRSEGGRILAVRTLRE